MQLKVFEMKHSVNSVRELRELITHRYNELYGAFWLSSGDETRPSLSVYCNGDRACAFYFRESGDSGYYSVGSDVGNDSDLVGFVIDNYQLDEYPMEWVVPLSDAVLALEEFLESESLPSAIDWVEA